MSLPPALIFSDLDGTLLDHDSYDWSPAAPLLQRLCAADVPVVLASSKTAAEMVPLRADMGLQACPLICENGAGLVGREGADSPTNGAAYDRIRAALGRVDAGLRACFEGFGDMGPQRISDVTGLPLEDAGKAAQRAFSEPGLWRGDAAQQQAFLDALGEQGISARMGGRFLTLSHGKTKADRMGEVKAMYGAPVTIALGDAPNDAEMLETADYGIVIANAHGSVMPQLDGEASGRIRRSTLPGPSGWSAALTGLLSDLGIEL